MALAGVTSALSACSAILGLEGDRTVADGGGVTSNPDAANTGSDATTGSDGSAGGPDATHPVDGATGPDATPGPDATAGPDATGRPDATGTPDGPSGTGDAGVDAPIIITGTCPQAKCTMASPLNHPYAMASDSTRVYWTEYGTDTGSADGKLRACPLGGCPDAGPIDYATGQSNPQGIALDGQNVYFGTAGGLLWCPLAGCPGGTPNLLAAAEQPFGITIAGGYVYWTEQGTIHNATVHRMAGPGQTNSTPYDGGTGVLTQPQQLAIDSQYIYLTDYLAEVYRIPVNGGEPTLIAPGVRSGGWPIALNAVSVYYGSIGAILGFQKSNPNGAGAVDQQVQDPNGLFMDNSTGYLYWSDWGSGNTNDGTIGKLPTDGGTPVPLSISQVTPEAVTVSGPYVYWLSNGTLDTTTGGGLPDSGVLYRGPK
jgi:hypothetical protein